MFIPSIRLLIWAGFILLSIGFPTNDADALPPINTAVVKTNVEAAFTGKDRVRVLIKLKEASPSPGRLLDKARIKALQLRVSDSFSQEEQAGEINITRKMQRIPWIAARISQKVLEKLRHHQHVAVIEEDIPIHASLTESGPQINGDRSYHTGYTGTGINVAVLDTGIDTDHPDLQDSLVWEECFLSEAPCPKTGVSRASGPGSAEDNNGHGSHVAGIITSDNETYRGVAPDAGIVAIKILDSGGNGSLSDLVAGLDWVADNHQTYNIRIVNMSLGSFVYEGICDAQGQSLADAANAVKAADIVLFAASGNDGAESRIDIPACLSSVVSVGAVYDAIVGNQSWSACTDATTTPDQIACFSNVSTVLDLLAPGARITSASRFGGTTVKSGTSMACPHAAAMASLLLAVDPSLTPDDLLTLMSTTGRPLYDDRIDLWFPRIDITAALEIDIAADPFAHDFDYVTPGEHSSPTLFTIANTGITDILLGSLSLSGDTPIDFQIVSDTCTGELLSGGGVCTIAIQFVPTARGARRANLLVPTDEPEAPELAIELKGWSGEAYFVNDAYTINDIWSTTTGDDGNDGLTPDTPKASVQSVLADYDLEPGDVVRIDTGLYLLESNIEILAEDSGDRDHPVAFTASPYGVMFDRGDQTLMCFPWYFNQCDYVTLTTVDDGTYPAVSRSWMELVGGFYGIYLYASEYIDINKVSVHRNAIRGIYANKSHNGRFANNLVFDNHFAGLILGAANSVTIENNTIIGGSAYAIDLDGTCNDVVLKNNIIIADSAGAACIYKSSTASFNASDYNLLLANNGAGIGYFDGYASDLADWQTLSGLDAHSISTDPLFTDQFQSDYHLSVGSPAIDAGDPTSDYSKEPQPNGDRINMAAYGGTLEAATSQPADWDGDGDVDGRDLAILAGNPAVIGLDAFALDFGRLGV